MGTIRLSRFEDTRDPHTSERESLRPPLLSYDSRSLRTRSSIAFLLCAFGDMPDLTYGFHCSPRMPKYAALIIAPYSRSVGICTPLSLSMSVATRLRLYTSLSLPLNVASSWSICVKSFVMRSAAPSIIQLLLLQRLPSADFCWNSRSLVVVTSPL